jgi:hypothetical protein
MKKITSILHEDLCKFVIASYLIIFKMKNSSDKFHENSKQTLYVEESFSDKYDFFSNVQK